MAVLMTLEVPGGTTATYDRTNEILGIAGEHDAPTDMPPLTPRIVPVYNRLHAPTRADA